MQQEHHTLVAVAAAAAVIAGGAAIFYSLGHRRRDAPRPTNFDAFLKTPIANPSLPKHPPPTRQQRRFSQPAATDFDSFLKTRIDNPSLLNQHPENAQAPPSRPIPAKSAVQALKSRQCPPKDSKPVVVVFGTEFGFSREIAEKLCTAVSAATEGGSFFPELYNMADFPTGVQLLDSCQVLLVVCSTQGDGVAPTEARAFHAWLMSAAAPKLHNVNFSVCALGDTAYPHFCACGRGIDARLEDLGAKRFLDRVDTNREDWSAVSAWISAAVVGLSSLNSLRTAEELQWRGLKASGVEEDGSGSEEQRWRKSRPYFATVAAVAGLCAVSSRDDKNTVRVDIDLGDSGIAYQPGDALGVWPTNDTAAVEELLAELSGSGETAVPLPPWHYADQLLEPGAETLPLRDALARCYDLRSPKPELLRLLLGKLQEAAAAATGDSDSDAAGADPGEGDSSPETPPRQNSANFKGSSSHFSLPELFQTTPAAALFPSEENHSCSADLSPGTPQMLLESVGSAAMAANIAQNACFAAAAAIAADHISAILVDPAATQRYLAERHVADVLREWRPAALSVTELLGTLRQLAPRLYSISSSQLANPQRVTLTVAVVNYQAHATGKWRAGVASTCLGARALPGSQIPVYLYSNPEFRLPEDPQTPIIMVGPGTGVAPFRAFLQHRQFLLAASSSKEAAVAASGEGLGPAVLFFGCRRCDEDYLYRSELEAWEKEGQVQLFTAFSREAGRKKVYVQHRMAEHAQQLMDLVMAHSNPAHVYICGDGAHMAMDVEAELLRSIGERQGFGNAAAEEYLRAMAQNGRYHKDVWISCN